MNIYVERLLTRIRCAHRTLVILLVGTFIVSSAIIINLNDKYLNLSESYDSQTTELAHLQTTLNEVEEVLNQLNITLASLETSSTVKAASMIISQVGLTYFNQHFHDPIVETAKYDSNTTVVTYKYDIEIGDYSVEKDVFFIFHPK